MAEERRWVKTGRGVAGLAVGSWRSTLIAAAVLVVLFVAVIAVATTSGPLRHSSFPGHPYPPSGFVQNPFSSNSDDLLSAADVARVRSEFDRDGQIDLRAVESGDTAILTQARTGNALDSLRKLIDANNGQGIAEREQIKDDAIVVGRLPDPNDPRIKWCVEERGSGTNTYFVKSTGQSIRTEKVSFDHRIWLVPDGDRYLITDVEVLSPAR
jgi:hypothetical protein